MKGTTVLGISLCIFLIIFVGTSEGRRRHGKKHHRRRDPSDESRSRSSSFSREKDVDGPDNFGPFSVFAKSAKKMMRRGGKDPKENGLFRIVWLQPKKEIENVDDEEDDKDDFSEEERERVRKQKKRRRQRQRRKKKNKAKRVQEEEESQDSLKVEAESSKVVGVKQGGTRDEEQKVPDADSNKGPSPLSPVSPIPIVP